MKSDLKIPLDQIHAEGFALDVEVDAGELGLVGEHWPPVSDVKLVGLLERSGNQEAVFRGRVFCSFELECSLGLARFSLPVDEELTVFFQPLRADQVGPDDEVELEEKELEVHRIEDDAVDLVAPLRDQLALAIPLQPRCPEKCLGDDPAVCERLMKGEGVSAGTGGDPRWAALGNWEKDNG